MTTTRGIEDPIRIGVVGTGAIAQLMHLPILRERHDVEILAVSDSDRAKAEAIAMRFEIPKVVGDGVLFADPEIEAVVVCAPSFLHEELAVGALENDKHVLVERPLALTSDGCQRVIDVAEARSRTLAAGMQHRFRADVAALRSFVAAGEFGHIDSARVEWLNRKVPLARTSWRQKPDEAGGGVLMDLGVPALDLGMWLLGYPAVNRVSAVMRIGDYEVEDAVCLTAVTEAGSCLTLEATWSHFAAQDVRMARIMGTEGSGQLPPLEVYKQLGGRPMDVTPRQPQPRGGEDLYTNGYRRELDQFLRVVAGEADAPGCKEHVTLMSLVEHAYQSAREGRELEI